MNRASVSMASLVVWVAGAALAAPLQDRVYKVDDRGYVRSFRIALDEVVLWAPDGEVVVDVPTRGSAEALRVFAEQLGRQAHTRADLVLYEIEAPHNEFTRRFVTADVLVRVARDADAVAVLARARVTGGTPVRGQRALAFVRAAGPGGALALAESLRGLPGIVAADAVLAKQQEPRYIPNDSYFPQQWHLRNTGQNGGTPGIDVNAIGVWDVYRGAGVRIGILDDGLQTGHPDLAPAADTVNDWDFYSGDADPNPSTRLNAVANKHGTSCAGVAAARGGNGQGVSGGAPEATLVGLRLTAGATTDQMEADAFAHRNDIIQIKNNSWGPADNGMNVEGPGPLGEAALAAACGSGRGGRGTIFVWAGGNGGEADDNANYDGYANSPYTIAIAAVDDQGRQASYSEPGACVVCATPSGNDPRQWITTTDLMGRFGYNTLRPGSDISDNDYTSTFGGTSSSAPLAAGVIALIVQANPALGWRDVQEILIRSATQNDASDSDWIVNGAGFQFNHKYGAGLVNAAAAVNLALTWPKVGARQSVTSPQSALSVVIPDDNVTGITRSFALGASGLRVEHATVTVTITHPYRGDLAITLIAPNGTQSRLAEVHADPGDNYSNWTFTSVRHWGESAAGTWQVKIADGAAGNTGTLNAIRLDLYGTN